MTAYLRPSHAIEELEREVDAAHPGRSKVSDGILGDAAHAARVSDHNPDENGIVHAADFSVWDGPDADPADDVANPLAEFLRAKRDPRTKYVIHRGRMFRGYDKPNIPAWTWSPYTGPNGHFHHVHVSVYGDDGSPWGYPFPAFPSTPQEFTVSPEDEAKIAALVAKAIAPLAADLAEVKRQVAKSEDAKSPRGETLRHITAAHAAKG